jgi:hypothetical protein
MAVRQQLIRKIQSLPEDKLEELAEFVELLEAGGKGRPGLAEHGMSNYLQELLSYEESLAAGKIEWR